MRIVTNIVLATTAAGALALGSAASAQDSKPEAAKPESAEQHPHGHEMPRAGGMRGGCHGEQGESRGRHEHS